MEGTIQPTCNIALNHVQDRVRRVLHVRRPARVFHEGDLGDCVITLFNKGTVDDSRTTL